VKEFVASVHTRMEKHTFDGFLLRCRYECTPMESLVGAEEQQESVQQTQPRQLYNLVLASEVLEHVNRPDQFCSILSQLAAPGATVIISTLNRTPASFALGIVGAEYVARIVPRCVLCGKGMVITW